MPKMPVAMEKTLPRNASSAAALSLPVRPFTPSMWWSTHTGPDPITQTTAPTRSTADGTETATTGHGLCTARRRLEAEAIGNAFESAAEAGAESRLAGISTFWLIAIQTPEVAERMRCL